MTISPTYPAAGKPASVLSGKRSGLLALTLTCLLTCVSATAQQQQQPSQQATITPAFRDAELTEIIDAVAPITGKTFIVDPRVRAQVTIRSSPPTRWPTRWTGSTRQ